jgi:CubicO group peptidase (beta-lactamase class C family)
VTKTMTGVLLADAVTKGEATLDTTVGEVLDAPGNCARVTLRSLATQRSGLPRLPPNLDVATVDQRDPYARYSPVDLLDSLGQVDRPVAGEFAYSNYGFMLLGYVLSAIGGAPFSSLIQERLFNPLMMQTAGCPPRESAARVPGYDGGDQTPWWTTQVPGPGGVGCSITDLARYLAAHLHPEASPVGDAISLATELHADGPSAMGLGWGHQDGAWFHDGATGGFSAFVAFHRASRSGVALLANAQQGALLSTTGFAVLTELTSA